VAASRQAESAHQAFAGIQDGAERAAAALDGVRQRTETEQKNAIALILDLTDVEESGKQLHAEMELLDRILGGTPAAGF